MVFYLAALTLACGVGAWDLLRAVGAIADSLERLSINAEAQDKAIKSLWRRVHELETSSSLHRGQINKNLDNIHKLRLM